MKVGRRASLARPRHLATLLLVLAFGLFGALAQSEPDPASVERGREIFTTTAGGVGCAACHGRFATGEIGPAIRGAGLDAITTALRNVPEMEFIALGDAEITDVVAYLLHLGRARPLVVTVRDGALSQSDVLVAPGERIQLIVHNVDTTAYELLSDTLGDRALAARGVTDVVWTAPEGASTYVIDLHDGMSVVASLLVTVAGE